MKLDVTFSFPQPLRIRWGAVTPPEIAAINHKLDTIMATQAELVKELRSVTAQIQKVGTEIDGLQSSVDTLTAEVAELEALIAAGEVNPGVTAALAEVKLALQKVDDDIPDKPQPPSGPV